MTGHTLVLNADGLPVSSVPLSTIHWQDAVRILVGDRAVALENYNKWLVRSPTIQLRMPSVIMLKEYKHHNGKVEFSRHNVILRDMYKCQYCGNQFDAHDLTFDHVIPRRDGGKTTWENIASACYPCNQEKAHHRHMKPLRDPWRPTYWELKANREKFPITVPHEKWVAHMSWSAEVIVTKVKTVDNIDQLDESIPFFGE